MINSTVLENIFLVIIIITLSALIIFYISNRLYKRRIKAINNALSNISKAINNENIDIKEEKQLIKTINEYSFELEKKVKDIKNEKEKRKTLINSITEGIIFIDLNERVTLINSAALQIFKLTIDVIDSSYYQLLRSNDILNIIKNGLTNKNSSIQTIKISNKYYKIKTNYIKTNPLIGLLLVVDDITDEYNLSEIKKDFFSNASHELKSPLTTIIGYQQLIEQGIYSRKEDINTAVKATIKEAYKMNDLVIDMLSISQLQSVKKEEYTSVNLLDVVLRNLETFKLKINEKNLLVKLELENVFKQMYHRHADDLIKNLIENAVKYNKDNENLEITLNNKYFRIKDYGYGIDKSEIQRIFERFYRGKTTTNIAGTGLGLAIVKHIASEYNFEIKVNSLIGNYTEFTINFN